VDESGPLGAGEIEPEENCGLATLLFVGGPNFNAFLIAEQRKVDGAGDVAVGELRRGTDVGDADRGPEGQILFYSDWTRQCFTGDENRTANIRIVEFYYLWIWFESEYSPAFAD